MTRDYEPGEDPLGDYEPPMPEPERESPPQGKLNPIEDAAERSVLACLLTTPKVFDDLCDTLRPADFGRPLHEAIYAAVVSCDASGRAFDPLSVADEMRRAGTMGGRDVTGYVQSLAASAAALESLSSHVAIVLDRSMRRRMVAAARAIGSAALDPTVEAASALDLAEQHVFDLSQQHAEPSLAPMAQILAKTQQQMAMARSKRLVGRPTGITKFDDLTGGLRGGQLVIVAARPAMGKSILALQWAAHIAASEGLPVAFFSYEMSHEELGIRLLAASTGISMNELNRGHIPTGDGMDRVFADAVENLGSLPLLIDDRPPSTVTGLRSEARRLARRGQLGAIVVDYLQLVEGDGTRKSGENRTQEVSYISRTLKQLAVELDVPVIAVSQLSRAPELRPNKRPQLADLRESGSLEQDANLVVGVYRDWVYDRSCPDEDAELILLKNRQGPLDTFALDFQGACARFANTDREPTSAPMPAPPAAGGGMGGARSATRVDLF